MLGPEYGRLFVENLYLMKGCFMYFNDVVSVIIPVYNADKFIKDTVLSAVRQTYKNMEIVIVDDRSTDKSKQIIEELNNIYPNIVYHLQDENGGAGIARNTALDIAKGRYVAFLDSDDLWAPEKTELQLDLMQKERAYFSYTAIEIIDEYGNVIKKKHDIKDKVSYDFLLKNTIIATSTVIIDRGRKGDFHMHLRRGGQDYATWLKLLRQDEVAYGINKALTKYRIRKDSLSANKLDSIRQVYEIQTIDEGINELKSTFNTLCFIINAIKKHWF